MVNHVIFDYDIFWMVYNYYVYLLRFCFACFALRLLYIMIRNITKKRINNASITHTINKILTEFRPS